MFATMSETIFAAKSTTPTAIVRKTAGVCGSKDCTVAGSFGGNIAAAAGSRSAYRLQNDLARSACKRRLRAGSMFTSENTPCRVPKPWHFTTGRRAGNGIRPAFAIGPDVAFGSMLSKAARH
jgi:hypothetical protein